MFEKHCLVAVYTASPVLLHISFVVATSPFENNIICNYKLQNQQKLPFLFHQFSIPNAASIVDRCYQYATSLTGMNKFKLQSILVMI